MTDKLAVIVSSAAISTVTLAIVFVLGAGNVEQVYAPPTGSCIACATQIEGSGFGTITIPEDSEIAPEPCPACFASLGFEAVTNSKEKVQNGTITIQYTDTEGVTQTLNGEFFDGSVGKDSFKLLGTIRPPPCPLCSDVDFTLKGAIQKGTVDSANLSLKASDGTTATFEDAKVTIISIPTET